MSKKRKLIKRIVALTLVFTMLNTSTSIAEALIHSGLIEYLGCVGDNIVRYYNAHTAHAEEGSEGTTDPSSGNVTYVTNNNYETNNIYNHNCDHTGVESGLTAVETAVNKTKGSVDAVKKALNEGDNSVKAAIDSLKKSNQNDSALLLIQLEYIADNTNTTADRLLWVYDELKYGGKTIAQLEAEHKELMQKLMDTWFTKNENYSVDNSYNMFSVVDNLKITRKTVVNSLGYTDAEGNPSKDGKNYIWAQSETRTLAGDLYYVNTQLSDNFGYFQYAKEAEDETFTLDKWQPSLAKDFRTLLSMYKNYVVAHIKSGNVVTNALWQPTPDDLSYTKERVLNEGFANVYEGEWSVPAADYQPSINYRYEYILGKDILTSYEEYSYDVNTVKDGDTERQELSVRHITEEMDKSKPVNLSDMLRILYRAVGQEVVKYDIEYVPDATIKAETSPTSVGLSNINQLSGYSVVVCVNRNNIRRTMDDNSVSYINIYLEKAKRDGIVSSNVTDAMAKETYPTYAELWYIAAMMMQRYGEPEMNSTEVNSLLQLYGSYYPVQEGTQVADAWSYLKARGILTTSDEAYQMINADTLLDIAMRIKDKDSRITYKDINLVISLDEAIVDNGYFPVFNDNVKVVDSYSDSITYDYNSDTYDLVVLGSYDAGEYYAVELRNGQESKKNEDINIIYRSAGYLHLSVPYSLSDVSGVAVYKTTTTNNTEENVLVFSISNDFMKGGILSVTGDTVTSRMSFDEYTGDIDFQSFVDNERSGKEVSFIFASLSASLWDRIAFCAKYIFTPHKAYAALDSKAFSQVLLLGGGGTNVTYSRDVEFNDEITCVLIALYPIVKRGNNTDGLSTVHKNNYTANILSRDGMTIIETFYDKYMISKNPADEQDIVEIALPVVMRYLSYNPCNNPTIPSNTNNISKTIEAKRNVLESMIISVLQSLAINSNNTYSLWNTGKEQYTIKYSGTTSFTGWITEIVNNGIDSSLVGTNQTDSSSLNTNTSGAENLTEQVQLSGTSVTSSITPTRDLYANTIMSKRNDLFISYAKLVELGIVATKATPRPDTNGCISFYVVDKGQIIIDTVNNKVSINTVFINLKNTVPVYITDEDLYINYVCLVGATATYAIDEDSIEVETTTSGSGKGATFQIATGLDATKGVTLTKRDYLGAEQKAVGLYGTNGVCSYLVTEYPNSDGESKTVVNQNIILLSGVFPLANWVIVEEYDKAYLYTFYNMHMFDLTWNTGMYNYQTPAEGDSGSFTWGADKTLKDQWKQENGVLSRIKIDNVLARDTLYTLYGTDDENLNGNGILTSTIYSLLSLAETTGMLVQNKHYACRKFSIEYATDTSNLEVGKVYFLNGAGYVYVAPTEYNHVDYLNGKNQLSLVYEGNKVVDYNLNSYGLMTYEDKSVDIPYGAVPVECIDDRKNTYYELYWIIDSLSEKEYMDTSGNKISLMHGSFIQAYFPNMTKNAQNSLIAAPVGIFKMVSPIGIDKVRVGTLTKYTTTACYFYLGTRRLVLSTSTSAEGYLSFGYPRHKDMAFDTLGTFRISADDSATVTTRDYNGRHHFVLTPDTKVSGAITINTVDASSYAVDYSDNPIYTGIKQWITNLDQTSTILLQILFYVVPYIMLVWMLLLVALALVPNKLVLGIGRMLGVDIVNILTLGRRDTTDWHSKKVIIPLIIAFISIGLFYGPNLLRIIEVVTDFAYKLSGLR